MEETDAEPGEMKVLLLKTTEGQFFLEISLFSNSEVQIVSLFEIDCAFFTQIYVNCFVSS